MPKVKISEFSSNPANNTDIDSINISEGCAPSGINDAIRELMAQLKDWQSGTSNDPYVVGSSGSLTLNQGTANGVAYLNGSKVVTSGSGLTYNGTTLTSTVSPNTASLIWTDATNGTARLETGTGASRIWSNVALAFGTNAESFTERMRLNDTGLGIGTSSPAFKLDVNGAVQATDYRAPSSSTFFLTGDNFRWRGTGGTELMRLDGSGNLGLGVTPSAWDSIIKVLELNNGVYYGAQTDSEPVLYMGANNYYGTGAFRYKLSSKAATRYQQDTGAHKWYNAPSGTAGNAITFTQAMTLDASGRLGIGTTSPAKLLHLSAGNDSASIDLQNTAGSYFRIIPANPGVDNTGLSFYDVTNAVTRARIDSSGNLLVGTTSGSERLRVSATNNAAGFLNTTAASATAFSWNQATSGNNIFYDFGTEASFTSRGSITYNRGAGLVAYNTTSDYRAKDISGPIVNSGTLIDSVPVYMGKMKGATQERPMFIAHETPSYAHTGGKDAVDENGNPVYQQMDASALIPVMWAEIQSLRKRLADAGIA
jgi:hypothetical protein